MLIQRRVKSHIHSNLNRKGNEGFPRKMKQLSSLHICIAE